MKTDQKILTIGQLYQAIVDKHQRGVTHPGLAEFKAPTGVNESTDTEGGYLVTSEMAQPILATIQQASKCWPKAVRLTTSSYGLLTPSVNETTRTADGADSLRCFWVGEAVKKTSDIVNFQKPHALKMHKLVALIPVTDEILQDVNALDGFLNTFVGQKLAWYVDAAMIYGDGATSMYGVASTGVSGTTTAAAADPLDMASLMNFEQALAPACSDRAEWYVSKDKYNEILDLLVSDDSMAAVTHFKDGRMILLGHPVNQMEQMENDPKEGNTDVLLGDFSQYVVATMGDAKRDVNISLRYDYDEKLIRWVLRINGDSFGNVYALEDGTTVGQFVIPQYSKPFESSSSQSLNSDSSGSSDSSQSLSSPSSQSLSSPSSQSLSSDSSGSSPSSQSESSGSSGSTHDESTSSKTLGCYEHYCGDFATAAYDGTYTATGTHGGKPAYTNGSWWIWYDTVTGYWALSNDVGDPQNQWKSSKDDAGGCPDGVWVDEAGTVVDGSC